MAWLVWRHSPQSCVFSGAQIDRQAPRRVSCILFARTVAVVLFVVPRHRAPFSSRRRALALRAVHAKKEKASQPASRPHAPSWGQGQGTRPGGGARGP